MAEVRSDSRICIQDKSGKIKTVICEVDYEKLGYKEAGWTVIKTDWTQNRKIKSRVDIMEHMQVSNMAKSIKK